MNQPVRRRILLFALHASLVVLGTSLATPSAVAEEPPGGPTLFLAGDWAVGAQDPTPGRVDWDLIETSSPASRPLASPRGSTAWPTSARPV